MVLIVLLKTASSITITRDESVKALVRKTSFYQPFSTVPVSSLHHVVGKMFVAFPTAPFSFVALICYFEDKLI